MADLGYALEVDLSGCSSRLAGRRGSDEIKREIKNNSKIFGLIQLIYW